MFSDIGSAYCTPSICPASTMPGTMASRFAASTTSVSGVRSFWKSFMIPGCGKIAMSGALLPETRVEIRVLKSGVGENLTVMPSAWAYLLISAWNWSELESVKPYMISTVSSEAFAPPALLSPGWLRQPAVRAVTRPAVNSAPAARAERDLMRIAWAPSSTRELQHRPAGACAGLPPVTMG